MCDINHREIPRCVSCRTPLFNLFPGHIAQFCPILRYSFHSHPGKRPCLPLSSANPPLTYVSADPPPVRPEPVEGRIFFFPDITEFAAGEHPLAHDLMHLLSCHFEPQARNYLLPYSSRHYRICVKKIDCTSVKNLPRAAVELEDLASTRDF